MTSAMESADTGQEPPAPGDTTGQADGSSPAVDQEWARRGRAYIVHTILFAAFLLALRIDKVLVYEFDPSPLTWVQVLSPEVSLLLLL
jgi:hypothetical protein